MSSDMYGGGDSAAIFRVAIGLAVMLAVANAYVYVAFAPKEIDDLAARAGTVVLPEGLRLPINRKIDAMDPTRKAIPNDFDPTSADPALDINRWKDKISPVEDQGSCGACWAFAATSCLADRLAISKGAAQPEVSPLSAQSVIDASISPKFAPECPGGDKCDCGSSVDDGMKVLRDMGALPLACIQYRGAAYPKCPTPNCAYGVATQHLYCTTMNGGGVAAVYSVDMSRPIVGPVAKFAEVYRLSPSDIVGLQEEIRTYGPIVAAMDLYSDFPRGPIDRADFVYARTPEATFEGVHAVKIVGWGSSPQPFWIVQNSWGTEWGREGFFRIARGTNECNIETRCYAGLAATGTA